MAWLVNKRMQLARGAAIVAICATSVCAAARADAVSIPDAPALHQKVMEFSKAFQAGDLKTYFSMFPPRLFGAEATAHNMTVQQVIDIATAEVGKALAAEAKIISFSVDDTTPRTVALPNGQTAILLPITDVRHLLQENKTVQMKSEALAINDNGTWYLMPFEEDWEYAGFIHVYPEFRGLKVEHSSTELKG